MIGGGFRATGLCGVVYAVQVQGAKQRLGAVVGAVRVLSKVDKQG